jgi:hypothetical protein
MTEPYRPRKDVLGPDGSPLTIADLPAPGTTRWVILLEPGWMVRDVKGGTAIEVSYEHARMH